MKTGTDKVSRIGRVIQLINHDSGIPLRFYRAVKKGKAVGRIHILHSFDHGSNLAYCGEVMGLMRRFIIPDYGAVCVDCIQAVEEEIMVSAMEKKLKG